MSLPHGFAGQGHINSLHLKLLLRQCGFQCGAAVSQLFFNGGTDFVCHLTHHGAFLRRKLPHRFQDGGQLALFAEKLYPRLLQRGKVFGILQAFQRACADRFQCGFHSDPSV